MKRSFKNQPSSSDRQRRGSPDRRGKKKKKKRKKRSCCIEEIIGTHDLGKGGKNCRGKKVEKPSEE